METVDVTITIKNIPKKQYDECEAHAKMNSMRKFGKVLDTYRNVEINCEDLLEHGAIAGLIILSQITSCSFTIAVINERINSLKQQKQ